MRRTQPHRTKTLPHLRRMPKMQRKLKEEDTIITIRTITEIERITDEIRDKLSELTMIESIGILEIIKSELLEELNYKEE